MRSFFRGVINIILVCVLVYCGYNIYIKVADYQKADNVYDEIRDVKETDNKVKMKENLSGINKDFKFWVEVDNTNIDYPVVQGEDNSYYLKRDFYGNSSSSGSIFMDYRNEYASDKNTILYGHNMRNKTMFSRLEKFKDEEFWKENNKIRIFGDSGEDVYEVFSVYVIDGGADYLNTDFGSDEEFERYLSDVRSKSIYQSNVKIGADDKIVTLSTCSYEFNDARTVVHGKLVK